MLSLLLSLKIRLLRMYKIAILKLSLALTHHPLTYLPNTLANSSYFMCGSQRPTHAARCTHSRLGRPLSFIIRISHILGPGLSFPTPVCALEKIRFGASSCAGEINFIDMFIIQSVLQRTPMHALTRLEWGAHSPLASPFDSAHYGPGFLLRSNSDRAGTF